MLWGHHLKRHEMFALLKNQTKEISQKYDVFVLGLAAEQACQC